ncbi:MAG: beta-galactosidase, partial [Verrucomicrobiota bacterium]
KKLRFSTWYWLNSIGKENWEQDFKVISQTGFTDLILCWGLDSAAVLSQQANTKTALDLCARHSLKAYLFIWHPVHNSLPRKTEFQQVDNRGNRLFTFNLFHREWRETQWKEYLQQIATAYKSHPAFAGYLFDDTFGIGPVGSLNGDKSATRGSFVSYSPYDIAQFQKWLRRKYKSLSHLEKSWQTGFKNWEKIEPPREIIANQEIRWNDWCEARLHWLREWSHDTIHFIRAIDKSSAHEIYLEDGEYILGRERKVSDSSRPITMKDILGLDFGSVASDFDAAGTYPAFRWDAPNALDNALKVTRRILGELRGVISHNKKIIYTFWAANAALNVPGKKVPSAEQIIAVSKAALEMGVKHIDYYGFRIGDWRVDDKEWKIFRPKNDLNYPVTKPLTDRFLCDRPDVLESLKKFFANLSN